MPSSLTALAQCASLFRLMKKAERLLRHDVCGTTLSPDVHSGRSTRTRHLLLCRQRALLRPLVLCHVDLHRVDSLLPSHPRTSSQDTSHEIGIFQAIGGTRAKVYLVFHSLLCHPSFSSSSHSPHCMDRRSVASC